MARRTKITLVCDLCGGDELVETHKIVVDKRAVELDADEKCWGGVLAKFVSVSKVGRRVAVTPRVAKQKQNGTLIEAVRMPGTDWTFSSHALVRMGERRVDPSSVIEVADNPEVTRPGARPELVVHQTKTLKVVLIPERRVIVTVGKRESDASLAEDVAS